MKDKIKEIRRKHEGFVYEGYEDDVHGAIGFLISEIDRLQEERDKLIEGLKYAHRFAKRDDLYDKDYVDGILKEIGVTVE